MPPTPHSQSLPLARSGRRTISPRTYWIATGLLAALFVGSAIFGVVDIDASKAEWLRLGYPFWTFWVLTVAKVLGIAAIIWNRSDTLRDFAFAGFLFDLLLAAGAHLAVPEVKAVLPIGCLGIWGFAFAVRRDASKSGSLYVNTVVPGSSRPMSTSTTGDSSF
jgi:DoxX-like family